MQNSKSVAILCNTIGTTPDYEFKQETKKDKIKTNDSGLGIATDLDILCNNCNVKASAPAAITTFKGVNVKEELASHKKSYDYQLNIKLSLGAIASGIGRTNLAQLLTFLDLPNVKAVNGRFFRNKELIVGTILRQVGAKSMNDALEEDIKLTLENEEKFEIWKQGNLTVSITVSFDMGWNKRSSGNRYDSISGHAFLYDDFRKR